MAKSFLFSLIISVLFLGVLELGLRLANFNYTPRPRIFSKPFVGMFHGTRDWIIPTVFDPPGYIWLMPQTIVGRDAQGNKIYEWPMEKKPGVKRICFLGGSTTQPDYMIDYPRRTIALLNNALGAGKYEGLNLGMSSYSSHHSLIALKRYGLPRQPDCVVTFDGWNEFGMWPDGYSEREHSRWMRSPNWVEPEAAQPHGRVVDFRVTRLISKFLNMADRTWPRLNTDFNEFRDNLDEELRICESRSIPAVVVKLPTTKRELTEDCLSPMAQKYYKAHFHTEDNLAMYNFHLMNCTNIQEAVVRKHPGVRMADAHTRLNDMHKEFEQNPHESVTVFIHDAKHCTPLGYQGIAEVAALAIEPAAAPQIKAYIASAAYWKFLAQEFQQMDNPFMCDYAVAQAVKRDAALEAELAPLRTWALSQYDFWRLYLANIRWAGPKVPLDQRLANLDKCIDMRPSDMGVLGSMFQAASWNGRTELAIPMLLKFKPTNDQDKYEWLRMLFQAYATARNWPETEKAARAMLAMNPNDQDAKAFFAAMQKSP